MNLPVGEVLQQGIAVKEIDTKALTLSLLDKRFSGYLVVTIDGFDGIEEGVVLFKEGFMAGAFYNYDNFNISVFGNSAMQQAMNALVAERGIIDIVALSNQQIDLVIAFHDKVKITVAIDKRQLEKIFPKVFTQEFAKKVLGGVVKEAESRKSVFKRLGLSELGT